MRYFIALWMMVVAILPQSVLAQSTGWLTNPNHPPVTARLMLTGEIDRQNNRVPAVLEVELADDWKTYWRSPGEGGIAPKITWSDSTNITDTDWQWPVPEAFSLLGLETFGYRGQVAFPLMLSLDDINANTHLDAKLTLSSCTTVCVLTDYDIDMDFVAEQLNADAEAMYSFNKAQVSVPQVQADGSDATSLIWDGAQQILQVRTQDNGWRNPTVIVDGEPDTTFKLRNISQFVDEQGQGWLQAQFDASNWLGEVNLSDIKLNVTVFDQQQALEYQVSTQSGVVQQSSASHGLLTMLFFALIGGLILNVMPCVLPVLGMKLSSVISAPSLEQGQIRRQFVASALGILVSFWLLAGFIMILKVSGQAIGWGVQFQNPYFIGFMIAVTAVFAFNMLGVFEINLPSSVQTKLASTGGNDTQGHFLQGMFATLLATPCSAPFLGTAVAFAFGADMLTLWLIFTALALGMALPWLVIAALPQLAGYFPKPGAWMNRVKLAFSGMLLLTSLWLISLLASFVPALYLWIAALLLALMFVVMVGRKLGLPAAVASVSIALAMVSVAAFMTSDRWAQTLPTDLDWVALDEQMIAEQVAQGNTVFVDVTADWCITCKANKVGVILQDPVYSQLKQEDIITMVGDWTRPSEHITGYLQSHNRFGVPFNIVYGPAAPQGIPLPVILSSDQVLAAIAQASAAQ
ncbi:protein-disulfide reductase DsbD family protein [Shewanella waksmanii]|uniref:protein-disulfide reductase DsbD family protein n=1 Tax=Shewanella waksmanii TaxID=213783 RepID=UPI00048C15A2|nr:protein-disulfide reductase DsbD domain-containing protein [Shewanella waksmanii]